MRNGLRAMIISGPPVDLFHNFQCRDGIAQAGRGPALQAYVLKKLRRLRFPGIVRRRKLPDGRFGRPHLRKHLVVTQALGTVAAAEPLDLKLSVPSVEFERKGIFPLGAARVQKRDLLLRRLEQQESVVVHRHVPEIGMGIPADLGKIAKEPAGEIDEMYSLIDQLAPAGELRLCAPFFFISDSSTMSVARPQEHRGTQNPRIEYFPRPAKSPVVTVVESYADQNLFPFG